MSDSTNITSRPFHPDQCCERCVFGRGEHAGWCDVDDEGMSTVDLGHALMQLAQTFFEVKIKRTPRAKFKEPDFDWSAVPSSPLPPR
jgi:hypothetical protein